MALSKPQRATLLLFLLLLLLAGGFGFQWWRSTQQDMTQKTQSDLVPAFDRAAVNHIEIAKSETRTVLDKKENGWVVTSEADAAADPVAIEQLIALIDKAEIEVVVSQRAAETAMQYGLDEANRISVVLKSGESVVTELLVGKIGSLPQTFYSMLPNTQTMYLVSGSRYSIDKTDWKKKE